MKRYNNVREGTEAMHMCGPVLFAGGKERTVQPDKDNPRALTSDRLSFLYWEDDLSGYLPDKRFMGQDPNFSVIDLY